MARRISSFVPPNKYIVSSDVSGSNITLKSNDGTSIVIDASSLVTAGSGNTVTSGTVSGNNLTLTLSDSSTVIVDVTDLVGGGGAVDSVAGKTGVVALVKGDVGLGSVDNTADLSKPVSTATQTALDLKVDVVAGSALITSTDQTKLDGIATGAQVNTVDSVAGKTGAVSLVKGDVGLGSVDNTSDANKPVSTAAQTALDLKLDATAHTPVASGAVDGNNLTLTLSDASTVVVDVTSLVGVGGSPFTITTAQTGALVAFDVWLADVSAGVQTRALPTSPADGDEIVIVDDKGNSFTNNITVGRGTKLIMGLAEDLAIDLDYARVHLKYDLASTDWRIIGS